MSAKITLFIKTHNTFLNKLKPMQTFKSASKKTWNLHLSDVFWF